MGHSAPGKGATTSGTEATEVWGHCWLFSMECLCHTWKERAPICPAAKEPRLALWPGKKAWPHTAWGTMLDWLLRGPCAQLRRKEMRGQAELELGEQSDTNSLSRLAAQLSGVSVGGRHEGQPPGSALHWPRWPGKATLSSQWVSQSTMPSVSKGCVAGAARWPQMSLSPAHCG